MRWKPTLLVASLVTSTSCIGTSVRPGQRGLEYLPLHSEGLQKKVLPEGFYFQWPWNSIVKYDVRWRSTTETVEVLTKDNLHISTRVTITYRPDEAQLYRLATEIGSSYYEKVIRPPFVTLARGEFSRHLHNDIPAESGAIELAIANAVQRSIAKQPLLVARVSIDHVEYDRMVTESISRKIATQQTAEQKQYEKRIAEQDADIVRTRAHGESDAIEIRASGEAHAIEARAAGEAQAIELRGKAQAAAQAAVAKTLTPRYLQFKAFDNPATRYFFVPTGKNGMPLLFSAGTDAPSTPPPREYSPSAVSQNEP